jgi:predicted nuclease with TOPRIM domain
MAKVKGSPVYRLKVVPHRPVKTAMIGLFFLLLLLVALAATYHYAQIQAGNERLTLQEAQELRAQLEKVTQEAEESRRELTRLQVGAEVDRQAGEEMRKRVLDLREEKAALERDIDVYRIMTSDKNKNPKGISFGIFSVSALPDNKHQLKLVVQKLAEGDDDFTGQLKFMVVGQKEGQETKISLHELVVSKVGAEPLTENIPLNFKFFQNIETEIALPEGFIPSRVELAVKADARRAPVTVEGQLEWPEIK